MVVCPGGGYGALAMDHEGYQIAGFLNSLGIAAFVLKYRLGPRYHHPAPLNDAQRAIRMVRLSREGTGRGAGPYRDLGIFGGRAPGVVGATHFDQGKADASGR